MEFFPFFFGGDEKPKSWAGVGFWKSLCFWGFGGKKGLALLEKPLKTSRAAPTSNIRVMARRSGLPRSFGKGKWQQNDAHSQCS